MLRKYLVALSLILSLAATLYGQSARQINPASILNRIEQKTKEVLAIPPAPVAGSRNQALKLLQDCYLLSEVSSEDHQQICVNNPAIPLAVGILTKDEAKLSKYQDKWLNFYRDSNSPSSSSPSSTSARTNSTAFRQFSQAGPAAKEAIINALGSEISQLSAEFGSGAMRGNWQKRIAAQAQLRILYEDLRASLPDGKILLPENPLALAGEENIRKSVASLKIEERGLKHFAALFPTPDVEITLESIADEIRSQEALLSSDQPGMYHRARDEIIATIDVEKWKQQTVNQPQRVTVERARFENEWKAKHPALILPSNPGHRVPVSSSISELALGAIRNYLVDPSEWLQNESALMAKYESARNRASASGNKLLPPYKKWLASLLSPSDLESALAFTKAITKQEGYAFGEEPLPFDPKSAHRRYYSELTESLQTELELRKKGKASVTADLLPPRSFRNTPDLNNSKLATIYAVRLADARWDSLSNMPEEIKAVVQKAYADAFDKELKQVRDVYNSFVEEANKAATVNEALDQSQTREKLTKARQAVSDVASRLNDLSEVRIKNGYITPDIKVKELKVMLQVLGSRPPPPLPPPTSGFPPDTPAPLGAASTLKPIKPGPHSGSAAAPLPSLSLSDAIFSSGMTDATNAVNDLRITFKDAPTQHASVGTSKGKLVVESKDLWGKGVAYDQIKLQDVPRMPESLQSWKGRINPQTKQPYKYKTEVKPLKSLAPVGGGIHFGDEATLAAHGDLKKYILTYDDNDKKLILLGPDGEKYSSDPISPEELKALYRYARTEQNMAISVGWTGVYDPEAKLSQESPVLLDPAFVDTRVGQILFEADSIPWKLDGEKLPNGEHNPFAKEFSSAYNTFYQSAPPSLAQFFRKVPKFEDKPISLWLSQFQGKNLMEILTTSLLSNANIKQAKNDFLGRTDFNKRKLVLDFVKATPGYGVDPQQIAAESGQLEWISLMVKQMEEAEKINTSSSTWIVSEVIPILMVSGRIEKKWAKLWAAIIKSKAPDASAELLSRYFLSEMPGATLAVLMDDPTSIHLENNRILLQGNMYYRYATSAMEVSAVDIRIGTALLKGKNQVNILTELTELGNRALPELMKHYEPLSRVRQYAGIVAFLRWAEKRGNLLALDLSKLAAYNASDRKRTPTPDAVIKR